MRTTLNIDDDLLREIKREANKSGMPLRSIVNAALRRGLIDSRPKRPQKRYVFPAYDLGQSVVNLDKALALAAGLEDAEILRKLELRK